MSFGLFLLTFVRASYIVAAQQYMKVGNSMTLDDYVTAIEAAHRLRVHPETVKRLCRQGDLPARKLHNTWLIRADDLDVFSSTYDPRPGAKRRLL